MATFRPMLNLITIAAKLLIFHFGRQCEQGSHQLELGLAQLVGNAKLLTCEISLVNLMYNLVPRTKLAAENFGQINSQFFEIQVIVQSCFKLLGKIKKA